MLVLDVIQTLRTLLRANSLYAVLYFYSASVFKN